MRISKLIFTFIAFSLSIAIVLTEPFPIIVRGVFGMIAADIVADFMVFVVIPCIGVKRNLFIKCFVGALKRKKRNHRPYVVIEMLNKLNSMSESTKSSVIQSSLLGPRPAVKAKHPLLRIVFGGIPTMIRGGKIPYLKHHLTNPVSIDHFGVMLISMLVVGFLVSILTGHAGHEIRPIYLDSIGINFLLPSEITYIVAFFLLFVGFVFLWNFLVYIMWLRILHWFHWLNVLARRIGS